jgi:hypothetical protein
MKNKFYGFLVYLKSLKVDEVRLNLSMDGRYVDHFEDMFYVGNKSYTIPSNFYSFFEKIIEKYADEIWENSRNENGDYYYHVTILVDRINKTMEMTSEIEEQTSVGESDEYDVSTMPLVQNFLDENNINYFEVKFSGGGDSGELNNTGSDEEDGPTATIGYPDELENFFYDKLESSFGGWEINEGSSGKIILDRNNLTIEIDLYSNEWMESGLSIIIKEDDLD